MTMSADRQGVLKKRSPWWHFLFGCVWQESKDGFDRRCYGCGRHQSLMNRGIWPSEWEDDDV